MQIVAVRPNMIVFSTAAAKWDNNWEIFHIWFNQPESNIGKNILIKEQGCLPWFDYQWKVWLVKMNKVDVETGKDLTCSVHNKYNDNQYKYKYK